MGMYIGRQRDIWISLVGSHLWHMETSESDSDYFRVYQIPTASIMYGEGYKGTEPQRQYINMATGKPVKCDETGWEIGYLINQLIKGNVNAIWGTVSPKVVVEIGIRPELEILLKGGMSKNIAPSVTGLANANFIKGKELEESDPKLSSKKYRIAVRTLKFGINWLCGDVKFEPVELATRKDVEDHFAIMDYTLKESHLRDKPNEVELRKWLFRLRMKDLNKEILSRFE